MEWGGAQIYFLSIIKNSDSQWKYKILLPKNSKKDIIDFFQPFNVEFDFIDTRLDSSNPTGITQKIRRQFRRIIAEYKIFKHLSKYNFENAVLHIEAAPWQSWILLLFLTMKTNVFVTVHNAMPHYVAKWRKTVWSFRLNILLRSKKFHIFTANVNAMESLKDYISPKYWDKMILTRASINPNEIDRVLSQSIDRNFILEKHNLPTDKFIVLCVGQFIDRKGRWIYLEAARKLLNENHSLQFVWLTPQVPSVDDIDKINSFELGDSFKLILSSEVGKKREDVLNFFRIADVFTLPSLWEGLPIAILEAMALGIPTISTNLNAIPEAVINYETGLLVDTNDSKQLAGAIIELYRDDELRNLLAKKGREFVIQNFDEKKAAEIALLNYAKCLK